MKQEPAGLGAAVLDGKIYLAGGEFIMTPDALNSAEVLDPARLYGVVHILGGWGRSADVIYGGRIFSHRTKELSGSR